MDFKLKLNDFCKRTITKIDNNLVPEEFNSDRRGLSVCVQTISEIIDQMGIASAKAQGLQKPITSADKLRNSDHIIYLLIDPEDNNGNGSIVGLLKVGRKKLYVFDTTGQCHYNLCLCILDFYVHESRQRQGCGKKLFEHLLQEEQIEPHELAIDRPSEKFLSFLRRHYKLDHIIPQNNNFVVFQGFFSKKLSGHPDTDVASPRKCNLSSPTSLKGENSHITYNGRRAAYKPETTIGKCLIWYPGQLQSEIPLRCNQAGHCSLPANRHVHLV